jgi:hypothetical protein
MSVPCGYLLRIEDRPQTKHRDSESKEGEADNQEKRGASWRWNEITGSGIQFFESLFLSGDASPSTLAVWVALGWSIFSNSRKKKRGFADMVSTWPVDHFVGLASTARPFEWIPSPLADMKQGLIFSNSSANLRFCPVLFKNDPLLCLSARS